MITQLTDSPEHEGKEVLAIGEDFVATEFLRQSKHYKSRREFGQVLLKKHDVLLVTDIEFDCDIDGNEFVYFAINDTQILGCVPRSVVFTMDDLF